MIIQHLLQRQPGGQVTAQVVQQGRLKADWQLVPHEEQTSARKKNSKRLEPNPRRRYGIIIDAIMQESCAYGDNQARFVLTVGLKLGHVTEHCLGNNQG